MNPDIAPEADNEPPLRPLHYTQFEDEHAGVAPAPGSALGASANDIELVLDVPVQITVELGRARMQIRQLTALTPGATIELDVLAGEPLDVVVNGCLLAQGEVVVVNDRYAVRLTDIVTPAERLRRLNR